jgi:hypothetical protein
MRLSRRSGNEGSQMFTDQTMLALSRGLSGLGRLEVAQAAKERGWTVLERELECCPGGAFDPAQEMVAARVIVPTRVVVPARARSSSGWGEWLWVP